MNRLKQDKIEDHIVIKQEMIWLSQAQLTDLAEATYNLAPSQFFCTHTR